MVGIRDCIVLAWSVGRTLWRWNTQSKTIMRFSGLLVNDNNHQWLGADPRSYRERGSPEICWWTQPAGLAAVGTRIGIQGLCVMWRDMSICLCYVPKHNDSYEAESVANAKGLPLSTNFRVNFVLRSCMHQEWDDGKRRWIIQMHRDRGWLGWFLAICSETGSV